MSRYLILAIETIGGISRKDTMTNNDYDISATLKKNNNYDCNTSGSLGIEKDVSRK